MFLCWCCKQEPKSKTMPNEEKTPKTPSKNQLYYRSASTCSTQTVSLSKTVSSADETGPPKRKKSLPVGGQLVTSTSVETGSHWYKRMLFGRFLVPQNPPKSTLVALGILEKPHWPFNHFNSKLKYYMTTHIDLQAKVAQKGHPC